MVEDWFEISWRELYPGWCCILSNTGGDIFLVRVDGLFFYIASIYGVRTAAKSATSDFITFYFSYLKMLLMRLNSFRKKVISLRAANEQRLGRQVKTDQAARNGASIRQATPSTEANSGAFFA